MSIMRMPLERPAKIAITWVFGYQQKENEGEDGQGKHGGEHS